jgi:hypothetical protein
VRVRVLTVLLLTRLQLRLVTVSIKVPLISVPVYDMMARLSLRLGGIVVSRPV